MSSPTPTKSSPTPIGDLLHTQKYEVKNYLLKQSDMSENLVEAVVSDIDKLRYPIKPGMTCVIEPGMTVCGRVGYDLMGD